MINFCHIKCQSFVLSDFENINLFIQITNFFYYYSSGFGKCIRQLARLGVIFHTIELAFSSIVDINGADKNEISKGFETKVVEIIKNFDESKFLINRVTLQRAVNCLTYFNHHKLILSGYEISPTDDFHQSIERLIEQQHSDYIFINMSLASNNSLMLKLMQRTLMASDKKVSSRQVGQGNFKNVDIEKAFILLQNQGLGKISKDRNGGAAKPALAFCKTSPTVIKSNIRLGQTITELGLNLGKVMDAYYGKPQYPISTEIDPTIAKFLNHLVPPGANTVSRSSSASFSMNSTFSRDSVSSLSSLSSTTSSSSSSSSQSFSSDLASNLSSNSSVSSNNSVKLKRPIAEVPITPSRAQQQRMRRVNSMNDFVLDADLPTKTAGLTISNIGQLNKIKKLNKEINIPYIIDQEIYEKFKTNPNNFAILSKTPEEYESAQDFNESEPANSRKKLVRSQSESNMQLNNNYAGVRGNLMSRLDEDESNSLFDHGSPIGQSTQNNDKQDTTVTNGFNGLVTGNAQVTGDGNGQITGNAQLAGFGSRNKYH